MHIYVIYLYMPISFYKLMFETTMVKAIDSDLGNLNSVATGTSVSCKVAFSQLFLLNEYE